MKNKNILTLIASVLLFIALIDGLPYGFFTFLRFFVTAVAFYLAYELYKVNKESLWVWALGGIGVLFNPIFPIHLQRDTWVVIDLIVGIFLVAYIFLVKQKSIN